MRKLLLLLLLASPLCAQTAPAPYVPTCLTAAQQATIVSTSAADAPLLGIDLTDAKMRWADAYCQQLAVTKGALADIATLKTEMLALMPPPPPPPPPVTAPIVQNPSFETFNPLSIPGPGPYNHGPIPNWTGPGGSWQPANGPFTSLCNGPTVVFTNGTLTQDLGGPPVAGTYTLTVCTGLRADVAADASATWVISLLAGSTVLCTATGLNSAIPVGTMVKQTLACPMPATIPPGDLFISLGVSGTEAVFDNVALVKQ
jgi:hypothetical protein